MDTKLERPSSLLEMEEGKIVETEQTQETEHEQKHEKKHEHDNIINVSTAKNFTFFVYLAKKFLEENDVVELHALGSAVTHAVQAADNLIKHKYATLEKIYTDSVMLQRNDGGDMKKAKLFIHLKKADTFDTAVAEFEKQREERHKDDEAYHKEYKE